MTTKKTVPTFKSPSSGKDLPVYAHSAAAEFIRVDNFDLFEYMLWHQNAARDTGNAKAEELRRNGALTLVSSPHADSATKCRHYFERLQTAFDTLLALNEEEKAARQNRGQAKGRLIAGWQEMLEGTCKRMDEGMVDTLRSSLERLHSHKAASAACDVLNAMKLAAWHNLSAAQQELASRLNLIGKTNVKEMAMHNILCARQLLLKQESATVDVAEQRESSSLSCATQFMISDQWELDTLGDKLSVGLPQVEKRVAGWGNMPSPVDY